MLLLSWNSWNIVLWKRELVWYIKRIFMFRDSNNRFCHWYSIMSDHIHNWSVVMVTLTQNYCLIWQSVGPYCMAGNNDRNKIWWNSLQIKTDKLCWWLRHMVSGKLLLMDINLTIRVQTIKLNIKLSQPHCKPSLSDLHDTYMKNVEWQIVIIVSDVDYCGTYLNLHK